MPLIIPTLHPAHCYRSLFTCYQTCDSYHIVSLQDDFLQCQCFKRSSLKLLYAFLAKKMTASLVRQRFRARLRMCGLPSICTGPWCERTNKTHRRLIKAKEDLSKETGDSSTLLGWQSIDMWQLGAKAGKD